LNPQMLLQAIRAHLGGGAPAPGAPAPDGGLPVGPPMAQNSPPSGGSGGNFSQLVQQMIDIGVQAMKSAPDAVDASGMAKIVSSLHQFQAQVQQDNDAAMGAGPAVRAMRRNAAPQ